jgi:hypothetical protein
VPKTLQATDQSALIIIGIFILLVMKVLEKIKITKISQRFSNYVKQRKISKNDFCDNPSIYLDVNDFNDLFKKVKFDITKHESKTLFFHKNPNSDEGYILVKSFFDSFPINWHEKEVVKEEIIKDLPNLVKINNEFKSIHDEVMQIVKKEEERAASSKKVSLNSAHVRNVHNLRSGSSKPKLGTVIIRPNTTIQSKPNVYSTGEIEFKPHKMTKFLVETTKKKQAEEEMLRVALEKRNKENEKEFLKKITEANQICQELNIQKAFSAFIEPYGNLMCKVYNKETNETYEIDYRKFVIEIRKLKKKKDQIDAAKMYQVDNIEDLNKKRSKVDKDNGYGKLNRKERQEEIKKILIESINAKQKLKKQLKALRDKKIKEEKIINDNLKLINLDDSS